MALSNLGWIDGITGSAVVILGLVFGVYFFYQGQKKKAKLLKLLAFVVIFAGLLYLGVLLDFASILTTGKNFPNNTNQVPLSSYIWFAPAMILAIYIAVSIQYPEKVWYAVVPYIVLGAIFDIWILLDPLGSFYSGFYDKSTPRLIDYNINLSSHAGRYLVIMLLPVILTFGVGLIYQSSKTTGMLKKKFVFLAMGAFCYGIAGVFEGFAKLGVVVIIVRTVYLTSLWLMYYGLKPLKV